MDITDLNFWGKTKCWWLILLVGILMIPCGFAYWIWPVMGYAIASIMFGWLLVAVGCVQVVIGGGVRVKGRWWWIIGGFIDLFIGFMLIQSILLSEVVLPYFLAVIFLYWGVSAIISAFSIQRKKYWWLQFSNGILLIIVGSLFLVNGYVSNIKMVDVLISLSFIYWGFSLCLFSYEIRPTTNDEVNNQLD